MKSRIFSFRELKQTSKGQLWIPAFITVAAFVLFPVVLLMNIEGFTQYEYVSVSYQYAVFWKEVIMSMSLLVAMGSAGINAINSFWYLYSRKKVDYYHSLPRKRGELFWHRVYTGLVYFLAPYVVMEFAGICIGAAGGYFSLELMGVAGMTFLASLLAYLLVYFVIVLVISMTGNLLMGVLCAGAVFLYVPALSVLISWMQDLFFKNSGLIRYGMTEKLFDLGSPITMTAELYEQYIGGNMGGTLVLMVAVIAALAAGAFLAYVKRPMEAVGKALVYKVWEPVVQILAVVPMTLGIGSIFYAATMTGVQTMETRGNLFWWIFGMLLGAVLSHGIVGMLFDMDFRGFVSRKLTFVISGVLAAVCALIFQKDLLGYDTYLPPYEELAGVSVGMYEEPVSDNVQKTSDGRYVFLGNAYGNYAELDDTYTLQNAAEATPELYGLMEEIIEGTQTESDQEKGYYRTVYYLKSGREICRWYGISKEHLRDFMLCRKEQQLSRGLRNSFLEIDTAHLQRITGIFADQKKYTLFQEDEEKREALVKAVTTDIEESRMEDYLENPSVYLQFSYEGIPMAETQSGLPVMKESSYTAPYMGGIYVYPGFKRTLALLEETGYPLSIEDLETRRAEICFYSHQEDGEYHPEAIRAIEDPGQLEELKKCLLLDSFWTEFQNVDGDMHVILYTSSGDQQIGANLMTDRLPDFVKELKEKHQKGELSQTEQE